MDLQPLAPGRQSRGRRGARGLQDGAARDQPEAEQGRASTPGRGHLHGGLVEVHQAFVSNILQMKYKVTFAVCVCSVVSFFKFSKSHLL